MMKKKSLILLLFLLFLFSCQRDFNNPFDPEASSHQDLILSSNHLYFSNVVSYTVSYQNLIIYNTTLEEMPITITYSGNTNFSGGNTSYTIDKDSKITFAVKFLPTDKKTYSGTITVDAGSSGKKTINLSGTGKATFTNTIGTEFILIEAGTFQMGSNNGDSDEQPIHTVNITKDYYIGKYEVTQGEWKKVMGSNPSYFKGDNLPVERVSWNDVQEFIKKLNKKEGTNKYRLPSEAEWEYAARGGNKSKGYEYSGSNSIGEVAEYEGNNSKSTKPVGGKKANELGIYDMSGNVWEWCSDWYDSGYYSSSLSTDPTGPTSGSYRVLRGGSWYISAINCRVAIRYYYYPSYSNIYYGFRIVYVHN